MTALTAAFAQGLHSARPSAAAGNAGYYYLETDTAGGTLFQSTGSVWVQVAPGVSSVAGAGTLTQIAQQISDGSGTYASFDFATIAGSYTDLLLSVEGRTTNAADQDVYLRCNNDSGANYYWQLLMGNGTSPTAAAAAGATQVKIGSLGGTGATAGAASAWQIVLPSYARTTFHKSIVASGSYITSALSTGLFVTESRGRWANTAAVTRVQVLPSAGNWATGSVATLWGRT